MNGYIFSSSKRRAANISSLLFMASVILYALTVSYHFKLQDKVYLIGAYHSIGLGQSKSDVSVASLEIENKILRQQLSEASVSTIKKRWGIHLTLVKLNGIRIIDDQLYYLIDQVASPNVYTNVSGLIGVSVTLKDIGSVIKPFTNRGMMVSVVDKTGRDYLVSGMGYKNKLQVEMMDPNVHLQIGDILYTSSVRPIYPAGIPVARIVESSQTYDGNWGTKADALYWQSGLKLIHSIGS